jgi:hypothetical protein
VLKLTTAIYVNITVANQNQVLFQNTRICVIIRMKMMNFDENFSYLYNISEMKIRISTQQINVMAKKVITDRMIFTYLCQCHTIKLFTN